MFTLYPITRDFDRIFDDFTSETFKLDENYPPYSIYTIEDEDGNSAFIEIALAGFNEDEIDVYEDSDGFLVVDGEKSSNNLDKKYLHRGISFRKFSKKFKIDKYEIGSAIFENGLLTIRLNQSPKKRREIPVIGRTIETTEAA